jgi:hypothetical protein
MDPGRGGYRALARFGAGFTALSASAGVRLHSAQAEAAAKICVWPAAGSRKWIPDLPDGVILKDSGRNASRDCGSLGAAAAEEEGYPRKTQQAGGGGNLGHNVNMCFNSIDGGDLFLNGNQAWFVGASTVNMEGEQAREGGGAAPDVEQAAVAFTEYNKVVPVMSSVPLLTTIRALVPPEAA